jgi:hypothetical protein
VPSTTSVDANDNTWTLDNSDTWASKLTQGDYTVIVNLSGNSPLKVVAAISLALIL